MFVESLPLGLLSFWVVLLVGRIGSLDQTDHRCCLQMHQPPSFVMKLCIYCYVVERFRIDARLVLKKKPDRFVYLVDEASSFLFRRKRVSTAKDGERLYAILAQLPEYVPHTLQA